MSSRLFDPAIQKHIYAIYGLVRVADEIVDTYMGADAGVILDELEAHVISQLKQTPHFSPNPIVQSFVSTAQAFDIPSSLIKPFFVSMRTDLTAQNFTKKAYDEYIYGSAEVIGLMCLKVFVNGDNELYETLKPGAQVLGSAYQKVNFLRDIAADYKERGRTYFPGVDYASFDDRTKRAIESDIEKDFLKAKKYIDKLPTNARKAIRTSYEYYLELLKKVQVVDAETLRHTRISVPNTRKAALFIKAKVLSS